MPDRVLKELSLAERCFDVTNAEDELFLKVNEILGCTKEEFREGKFAAIDTRVDQYDRSIEVIRPENSTPMGRLQSGNIISLGFACVFETIGQEAVCWTLCQGPSKVRPKEADDSCYYRARFKTLLEGYTNFNPHTSLNQHLFTGLRNVGEWIEFVKHLGRILARNRNAASTWEIACTSDQDAVAYRIGPFVSATVAEILEAKFLVGKPLMEVEDHFMRPTIPPAEYWSYIDPVSMFAEEHLPKE